MALITAEARQELIALHVAMFKAAPGADRLSSMVAAAESGKTLFEIAAAAAADTSLGFGQVYPGLQTGAEFANSLADILLAGDTIQGARTWAINWATTQLAAGVSRSDIIVAAVQALRINTNADFNSAETKLANLVAVAEYYSVTKLESSTDLEALQSVIAGVDQTQASVDAAKAVIDGEAEQGTTFTLTTSASDVVNGTSSNDTIIGDWNTTGGGEGTLQASDFIDGNDGIDTLRVFSFASGGSDTLPVSVQEVEIINYVAPGAGVAINTSSLSGVTKVFLEKADAFNNTVTTGSGQSLQLSTTSAGMAAALTWVSSGTTGNLELSGFNDKGFTVVNAADTTLNITSNTGSNTASLAAAALVTLNVVGDTALDIDAAALAATTKTINAGTFTGALSVKLGAVAADTTVTSGTGKDSLDVSAVTGKTTLNAGAGDDTVTLGAAAWQADGTYNGGDGKDTVAILNGANLTALSGKQLSNFEVLSTGAGTGVYDVDFVSGITAVTVGAITGATTIKNITTQSVTLTATQAQTLTASLKDATGTADSLTLKINGTADVAAGTILTTAIESLTIDSATASTNTAGVNNSIASLNVLNATTLTFTGSHALTVTAFANATAVTKIDASGLTKGLTMGAATGAAVGGTYIGGAGVDTFIGNGGGDTYSGGGNGDLITLGGGTDTLIYQAGGDSQIGLTAAGALSTTKMDSITGFATGADSIDLGAFGFTGAAQSGLTNKGVIVPATVLLNLATSGGADFFSDGVVDRGVAIANDGTDTFVFVDVNKDGNFTASADLVIELAGITTVALADFGF